MENALAGQFNPVLSLWGKFTTIGSQVDDRQKRDHMAWDELEARVFEEVYSHQDYDRSTIKEI